ncbi:CRISPR-associated RAMP protein Csx10 [Candidatus Caldatribacterium sp.]|uniref:type III-D CRISPR-associated RAMP protein Csx10 n=1 Tax=Candidatus Caldatribacterium sp. TaxID=2282143 RepID=UPI00384656FB|nr:CRISPR-associated RAMP protein Csx10 [Candidatus Caldatribacterium sp.]
MKLYYIAVEPLTPLRVGGIKPKNDFLNTLNYIPGSVLRGTLAEWLKTKKREDMILPQVQRMRFGNLFPANARAHFALPVPFTALECKLHGGFTREGGHGVRDSLLVALAYKELERSGARFPIPMAFRCKNCSGRMERISGFCVRTPEGWCKTGVPLYPQTKVALSRTRRTAQEGMLYRVFGIPPVEGLVFSGRIWAEEDSDVELLKEAVEYLGIGAMTTRGFGKVRFKQKPNSYPPLEERLCRFNETLQRVWEDLAELAAQASRAPLRKPQGTYFSVDLLSPGIFQDTYGLPSLVPHLPIEGKKVELVFHATQPTFSGGWSTAWGLPKPTALAAAPGSTYVFRTDIPLEELVPLLEEIENQGLGKRTPEGFGEITICHPLHEEVMPV